MQITPAILADSAESAFPKLFHPDFGHHTTFHLDVLDGSLFGAHCFADPDVLASWVQLPNIELHLMVDDPKSILQRFRAARIAIANTIVHAEITRPIAPALEYARLCGSASTLALSPEVAPDAARPYLSLLSEIMIMGVYPGSSGQTFLGEPILAKIRRTKELFPHLPISVDGGVSEHNIAAIARTGATRCIVASALWESWSPLHAMQTLLEKSEAL